ncbi:MAG: hypothetical protein ABW252_03470 [Polyangiales bacterium]
MSRVHALGLGALLLASGCGGALFSKRFPTGTEYLSNALVRAKQAPAPLAYDSIVVGVASEPDGVFAYDLRAGRLLFREPCKPTAAPSIAGELVVVPEQGRFVVRRLSDGEVVRTISDGGLSLAGADGDGKLAAVALTNGGALNARSRILLFEGEKLRTDVKVSRLVGRPAVLGGLAFVPHNRVQLSVIDAQGTELARVRIKRDVASYAFAQDSDVYFGQRGVYLVDTELARNDGEGAKYLPLEPAEKLPGGPPPLPDTTAPRPPIDSAQHRVNLEFAVGRSGGELALADDALYFGFYRLLFSLSADGTRAHWVHKTPTDVVGAHASPGGVVVVEQSGQVTALDPSGRVSFVANLGLTPVAARFRTGHLGGAGSSDALGASNSLAEAANDPDARLVPAQALAAKLLGEIDDEQSAQALIELCAREESTNTVSGAACKALSARKTQSEAVLAALERHPSFLDPGPEPPLAALSDAARNAGDKRAVEGLLEQLADPATPVEALRPMLQALGALGDEKTARPIAQFLRLYHAEPGEFGIDEALIAGMEALAKLDPEGARATLAALKEDPLGQIGVRTGAERVLASIAPKPAPEEEKTAEAAPEEPEAPPPEPPSQLTSEHLDQALSAVRPDLARCVRDAPDKPASARFTLIIDGAGDLIDMKALPASVRPCAAPLIQSARFPANKYGKRSVMSYVVAR